MRRPQEVALEEATMRTIVGLTNAFQGLASMRIMQSKSKVLQAKAYFEELWQIYEQIRVDALFRFGRTQNEKSNDKELFILITAAGGLSGDIDQRLVRMVQKVYDEKKHDVMVIGRHGAQQLKQAGIEYKKYFKLPEKDNINVEPLMDQVRQYENARVFYQSYESLTKQTVKSVDLGSVVAAHEREVRPGDLIIDESTYIFEPNTYSVVAYLERSMIRLMLAEVIFESRLAQYASQFRAMSQASERSSETAGELHTEYNRAKRAVIDQRLKEMISGLKKVRQAGGNL